MEGNVKRVLSVTGIRAEYDIMFPVYKAIESKKNLSLELIVTGAHLSPAYGYTVNNILADGFTIVDKIENLILSIELES